MDILEKLGGKRQSGEYKITCQPNEGKGPRVMECKVFKRIPTEQGETEQEVALSNYYLPSDDKQPAKIINFNGDPVTLERLHTYVSSIIPLQWRPPKNEESL